ncbi:MAG TPA: outer membrane beta-barrel protein, partial [Bacteroidia bacterium]|nr:outer membrane beta-barrel protein [Bacteroidia bacterium]
MKKIFFSLFLPVFLLPLHTHAQVTGTVTDSLGQPLPFCNVMLLNAADSSVVTGTTGDDKGSFSLEKKRDGNFLVMAIFSGYEKYYSLPFSLSETQPKYNAGTIVLRADPKLLGSVDIVAQKPFMEQKLDRVVFNIDNSVVASGSNALELLKKLPGVMVDNNDNIQVRGKPGVQIMINGRTSYLSGGDIANYLKSIDASQVERIEVITNPSAKYDAAGNAIINIVLKTNKNMGLNGQVNVNSGQGFYNETDVNLNLDYRMKKWNFYVNQSNSEGRFYDQAHRTATFSQGGTPNAVFESDQRIFYHGHWNYTNAGVDFSPGTRQTIGASAEFSGGSRVQNRTFSVDMYDGNSVLDSSLFTNGAQRDTQLYLTYSMYYQFRIDTNGRELSADISYAPFSTTASRTNTTSYEYANSASRQPSVLFYRLPVNVDIRAGQIDYVQPFGQNTKFETGAKASYVSTDNNARYYNVVQDVYSEDTTLSNHFLYTEKI